jgi:membrane protein required for colicin V production
MENIKFFIVDIFIVIVILLSFVYGWARGATKEIFSVLSWVGGIYLSISIFPFIKDITRSYITQGLIADFVSITGLFILFLTLLSILNYVCTNFIKKSILNATDKVLGGIFGILRGVLILAIMDFVVTQWFLTETPKLITNSQLRSSISKVSNFVLLILPDSVQAQIIGHLSQAKRQTLLEFLKDDVFEQITNDYKQATPQNGNKAEALINNELIELDKESTISVQSKPPSQSAEELSHLKPKKNGIEIKKSKEQKKRERLDMDRLLDQYDDDDSDGEI